MPTGVHVVVMRLATPLECVQAQCALRASTALNMQLMMYENVCKLPVIMHDLLELLTFLNGAGGVPTTNIAR